MTDLCSSLFVSCEMLLVSPGGQKTTKQRRVGLLEGKGHRKESNDRNLRTPERQNTKLFVYGTFIIRHFNYWFLPTNCVVTVALIN